MTAPLASVVIVNWNGRQFLPDCLDSLRAQTCTDCEVIVVDNGSSDGSLELLAASYPWVQVVPLEKNTGFAGGNNAGFAVARGTYVITLNNDTRVEPDWLAELIAPAQANQAVGMVASRICSWDDPDQVDSLGVAVCRDGMSRGNRRLQRFSSLSIGKTEEIFIPSACAALYRRKMLDQIGFFDEDFFAYCEDTDLGLRGRVAGWLALLARDAVVYHRYSSSGGVFSPFKLYLVERNHYWAAMKSLPLSMLIALPFWTVVRYAVQARLVVTSKGSGGQFRDATPLPLVMALLRGMRDAALGLPGLMKKRKTVMVTRGLSSAEMHALVRRYSITFSELLDAA